MDYGAGSMADKNNLYLLFAEDVSDSEALRSPLRREHIERREALHAAGRIVVSGPLTDSDSTSPYCGSLLVGRFSSLNEATEWAMADPYVQGGVYKNVVVRRIQTHFLQPPVSE